jgi:hypothetical protein
LNIESSDFFRQDFLAILRTTPQIESIRLKAVVFGTMELPSDHSNIVNPPILNYLTTLVLDNALGSGVILFLDIPALQTLRLSGLPSRYIEPQLRYWISTSPKFLSEFSMNNMVVDNSLLLDLLQTSPKLEVLCLNNMFNGCNAIIQSLSKPISAISEETHPSCLCPHLRHLDVSHCPDVETSVVQELVKQRVTLSSAAEREAIEHEETQIRVNRLEVLKMDGCEKVDLRWLPWFIEHVPKVSCRRGFTPKTKQRNVARRMWVYPPSNLL